mmetsp:Transcript_53789/g.174977  ORF Transcript_53789/g.174977 Transcript_53789/m.174977 type:complete len:94 (-) Transcript_53789:1110-1391(-)
MKVPFQSEGTGTAFVTQVVFFTVWTQAVQVSSFTTQEKPMLQHSASFSQFWRAQEHPEGYFVRGCPGPCSSSPWCRRCWGHRCWNKKPKCRPS